MGELLLRRVDVLTRDRSEESFLRLVDAGRGKGYGNPL
jgi:hypothetical protein